MEVLLYIIIFIAASVLATVLFDSLHPKKEGNQYFVKGGTYTDTTFSEEVDVKTYGPYSSYYEAEAMWRGLSYDKVDNCNNRFFITKE